MYDPASHRRIWKTIPFTVEHTGETLRGVLQYTNPWEVILAGVTPGGRVIQLDSFYHVMFMARSEFTQFLRGGEPIPEVQAWARSRLVEAAEAGRLVERAPPAPPRVTHPRARFQGRDFYVRRDVLADVMDALADGRELPWRWGHVIPVENDPVDSWFFDLDEPLDARLLHAIARGLRGRSLPPFRGTAWVLAEVGPLAPDVEARFMEFIPYAIRKGYGPRVISAPIGGVASRGSSLVYAEGAACGRAVELANALDSDACILVNPSGLDSRSVMPRVFTLCLTEQHGQRPWPEAAHVFIAALREGQPSDFLDGIHPFMRGLKNDQWPRLRIRED